MDGKEHAIIGSKDPPAPIVNESTRQQSKG